MKWLLGAAVLLSLSACSSADADIPAMEDEIAGKLEDQTGAKGVSIDCPDQIDWETGRDFHCFAEDRRGQTSRVTVTMENDSGEWSWQLG